MNDQMRRSNSNMIDHIKLAADFGPKPGDMGEHQRETHRVRALLAWVMSDRIVHCRCRTCATRRIMMSLPERILKRADGMTPCDIEVINDEVARLIGEIAESDIQCAGQQKNSDDDIPF